ncbi:MAG TPA: hypothetical protein VG328_07415 [Stellaceae bacterium]|jgi:hypothetical protein|nr:hypothetical protein [Stellaceae bacterium]
MAAAGKDATVPVSRIFLHLENPRHEPVGTEAEAIEYLCSHENVYALARDIARMGLSQVDRFAVIPVESHSRKGSVSTNYYSAEGNRRLCALKLLNDPDLAPAKLRNSFEKLAKDWTPITHVGAVVYPNLDAFKPWRDRIHNGPQGGIGRKDWNAEQKQRASGSSKNRAAQALLDYAEAQKIITPAERKGKLTTVQRFVGNDVFSEVLGLHQGNPEELARNRSKPEFDILVKRFMRDLIGGKAVNSRMNKDKIIEYARPLAQTPGVTTKRIEPEALSTNGGSAKDRKSRKRRPTKPPKARHVGYEPEIYDALKAWGNEKLQSLYYSICDIELEHHTPLVCVGAWAFFETLTACAGRPAAVSFEAFLNKSKLNTYGLGDNTVSHRAAVGRILEYGNTTKHHAVSAAFNGDQLNNDMTTLKIVILKCIEEAAKKTP